MPRSARLDASGVLHHVIARGIERRCIFRDDDDRADFVERLAARCRSADLDVLAWALIPNHVHLLARSRDRGISRVLQGVLGGYAREFNRRHRRHGHLFQNRFKSIVVEEEPYLLELVRYIHLNPVRAGLVADCEALRSFPWSGHARILGEIDDHWQATDAVLCLFGQRVGPARRAYARFLEDGLALGTRPDLRGGGLRRSRARCEVTDSLGRGREAWAFDERVLGSSEFVLALRQHEVEQRRHLRPSASPEEILPGLTERVAATSRLTVAELCSGSKRRSIVRARAALAFLALREAGLPASAVALVLGVTPRALAYALPLGETVARELGLHPST